jgi:acetate kinase
MQRTRLLAVNAGSSSVRLALFGVARRECRLLKAARLGALEAQAPQSGLEQFLGGDRTQLAAVAHRVVHGGEFAAPSLVDAAVERAIDALAPLAPNHNPLALAWLRASRALAGPAVPQVAVFDTAFYVGLPDAARYYALPGALAARHRVRRYGFHGLAHQAMWRRWRQLAPQVPHGGRVVSFQLGSGCSVTAIAHGRPLETSMGFSPLEGLMMATRSGDVDPAAVLYLQRAEGLTAQEAERLLHQASGLLGIAGDADLQAILAREDAAARLAVRMYCHRARKYLGAFLAVLGGAQAVLFGGGVGENAPAVRARILDGMQWAGIALDPAANEVAGSEARISAQTAMVQAWVIPVDEATLLAEETLALLERNLAKQGGS